MKLVLIEYNGTKHYKECKSFEFRGNHVENWIVFDDGTEIKDVCVIKTDMQTPHAS